jgi:hypothetical protein
VWDHKADVRFRRFRWLDWIKFTLLTIFVQLSGGAVVAWNFFNSFDYAKAYTELGFSRMDIAASAGEQPIPFCHVLFYCLVRTVLFLSIYKVCTYILLLDYTYKYE